MPTVHGFKRLYAHTLRYPSTDAPMAEAGRTQEICDPYRSGRSVVIRAPFTTRALVLGVWVSSLPEEEALLRAVGGSFVKYLGSEFRGTVPEVSKASVDTSPEGGVQGQGPEHQ